MLQIAYALLVVALPAAPLYEAELVFPGEPKHNHSPGIVETADGDLLVCWFHGVGEKTDDSLVIRGARKKRGADQWSAPFLMADNQNLPDQNCVLFIDPRGKLWLFWISSLDNTSDTYLLKYRTSSDYAGDGPPKWDWQDVLHCRPVNLQQRYPESAEQAREEFAEEIKTNERLRTRLEYGVTTSKDKLARRLGWMTRTHPIMLSDTRMMLPLYSDIFNCSLAAFTDDWGKTWEFSEPILPLNVQPSFVRKQNGDIVAMMRDKSPRRRIPRSVSHDGGQTWTQTQGMEIPNPDSSVECIALKSGNWLLVCNDTTGGDRGGRTQLTAYLSDDEGETWKWHRTLEKHDASTAAAYPSVIESRDGSILCTYTHSPSPNETIKVVRFNEDWVRAGDAAQ
ncbi:hypothetical protein Pan258_31390 [Symmachiella dynata]|uniref:sialidase family protein n=1 Tax=Symmachiella dynata TaxID=2527995 RepID=UPI001187DDC6|nr:sialidase family protein [Symmachiella dynata]QDT49092.1 hypothetical protein Pan258_31390 [Symmachiella dynata]